ncbi:hypothetical protein SAMN02745170_01832 [Propionispora hippei DSM 15287]|uniref:Uncharacterized protein n=1 Tax=Propionispora hippei DSM 15287 TaxID=1123003 RepID=A0A1M6GZF0_9FIRM|nr:DUF6765 family protein [Propionispora hippei]SHJ15312.1 hypothetical protein SAMN02745170_01832 [Propionispora hippei DSM 15287]
MRESKCVIAGYNRDRDSIFGKSLKRLETYSLSSCFLQKDFHYAGTYVLARLAGFTQEQAGKIATCALYVDDATFDGVIINPESKEEYYCIRSAHCNENLAMDVETFKDQKYNQQVWASFHFLPGNGELTLEEGTTLRLADKLVCKPNSYIARDMVRHSIIEMMKTR